MKNQNLREEVHFRVLRLLSEKPSASQREISSALGVSLGLVNYCLNSLIERGLVKISNFRASDNKLRYAYVLTPAGIADKIHLTTRFLQRKVAEFEELKREIEILKEETLVLDHDHVQNYNKRRTSSQTAEFVQTVARSRRV